MTVGGKHDVWIEQTERKARVRSPALVVLFSVATFGIYSFFWWYRINRELAALGYSRSADELGDRPGLSVAAFTIGSLVYIPWIWTIAATTRRIQRAQALTAGASLNGWLVAAFVILTLGLAAWPYLQMELNKVWRTPGMRPVGDADRMPDATTGERWDAVLAELHKSGHLADDELSAQRDRLSLA